MEESRNNRGLTSTQLLELVRSSLWNRQPDPNLFPTAQTDWDEIGRLAMEQTVGVLAMTAALSLPDSKLPPEEWRRKAYAFIERNRRTHRLVDGCVAEAVKSLQEAGLKPVLLKGQAYARVYPNPELRQCGDIDIYVGHSDFLKAYNAAKQMGWKIEQEFNPEAKHCGFCIRGVRIELHRVAAILTPASIDRKFQGWSRKPLNQSNRQLQISDNPVPIPTSLFDVVFVFLHFYHHFLNGGIGLRHICDWTILLHAHSGQINLNQLASLLKDFRLMNAWRLFASIAVNQLGLPESECPFYSGKYHRKSERILQCILREGNFGRARKDETKRPDGYLTGKLHSFKRNTKSLLGKAWIDPHTISRTYLSYIYRGITQMINETMNSIIL